MAMSVDITAAPIPVVLTYHEARAVRSVASYHAKRLRQRDAKAPFTPSPGKLNGNLERAATLEAVAAKIDAALDIGIDAHKEAANGQG
jgi:hypothetical protein